MKQVAITFIAFLPASILCGAAFMLAFYGLPGWGWFLVVAVLLGGSVSFTDKHS